MVKLVLAFGLKNTQMATVDLDTIAVSLPVSAQIAWIGPGPKVGNLAAIQHCSRFNK